MIRLFYVNMGKKNINSIIDPKILTASQGLEMPILLLKIPAKNSAFLLKGNQISKFREY